jgi:hypothetical protein
MSREERVYEVGPKLRFTLTEHHLIEEGSLRVTRAGRRGGPARAKSLFITFRCPTSVRRPSKTVHYVTPPVRLRATFSPRGGWGDGYW